MASIPQLKRDIARLRKRIEGRDLLNRQDEAEIILYEEMIKRMEALTGGNHNGRVNTVTPAHRQALSEATVPRRGDDFLEALHRAGFVSMRALATKLGVSAAFISRVRSGHRPMPDHLADHIERLTGYKKAHWKR